MNGGFGLSCAKYIEIGSPRSAGCPPGKENNAGLCYKACKPGYKGVGPVCWAVTPKDWLVVEWVPPKTAKLVQKQSSIRFPLLDSLQLISLLWEAQRLLQVQLLLPKKPQSYPN